jgi:hypothetical protein
VQVKVEQHVPYIDGAFSESSGTRGQDPAMLFDAPIDRFSLAYVFWVWEGVSLNSFSLALYELLATYIPTLLREEPKLKMVVH